MPSDKNRANMGWRDKLPAAKSPAGKRDWQRDQPVAAAAKKKGWSRRSRFTFVAIAFLVCAGVAVWLILKVIPPKPARLVLIGADYNEPSLAIPHNEYGWQGVQDLHDWSQEVQGRGGLWGKSGVPVFHDKGPQVLKVDDEWDKGLDGIKNEAVVIFMALHGGADTKGAYLLPQNADPGNKDQRLYLENMLERLQRDDLKKKKIVLVLDPTQVEANAFNGHGMLHNDFVRRLKGHDEEIGKAGNLVVICSTDVNQRSWVSEEWRQSIFTHYLLEGLKGGAGQSNVTIFDLFDFVAKKVPKWVGANRADLQEPILLPSGEKGEKLAKEIVLEIAPDGYKEEDPEDAPGNEFTSPAELDKAWSDYQKLADEFPSPAVYTPRLWRRYRELLLRYEQLLRAGQDAKAADRAKELAALKKSIEQARTLSLTSWTVSLATPAALGQSPAWLWGKPDYKDKFTQFLNATDPGKAWADVRLWAEKDQKTTDVRLLKLRWASLLLQSDVLKRDGMDPAKLDQLFDPLDKDGWFRPAEVNFERMLPYLSANALPEIPNVNNRPWREALALRRAAEETAWTISIGNPDAGAKSPYSEIVYRWIKTKVDKADEVRRKAEDRLFAGDQKEWDQVKVDLDQADAIYKDSSDEAAIVREALRVRDEVLADLPYLSRWLANRHLTDAAAKADEELAKDADTQVAVWEGAHALTNRLQQPDAWLRGTRPRDMGEKGPTLSLKEQMEKVRSDFNLLKHNPDKKGFLDRCEELSQRKADVQRIWQEIDDALEVPWIPIGVRKDLLTRDRAISSSFNRTPPKNERTPTAPEQEQLARKFARRQGELTMAVMGDSSADKRIDPKFGESADWWQIAARDSDEKVGDGWQKKAQQLVDLVAKKNRAAVPDELDRTYIQADRLARIIDGTAKVDPRTAPDPGVTKRRLDLHRFFCWQAERSYKDHWYDRDDNNKIDGEKYYMKAVKSLLNDAESFVLAEQTDLSDGDKNLRRTLVDAERTQLVPYGIQVVRSDSKSKDPRVTWTTEAVLKLEYLWKVVDDKDAAFKEPLNGFPVFWRATDKPLPEPADYRQVKVQRSLEKKTEAPDEIELRHPGPDVKGSGQVTYTAMFRGQVLTPSTFVDLQTRPDVVVYQHKVPLGGALAARSNLTTHLSIIIDFSGSMKQNLKDGKQKKAAALNALNSLLPALSRNDGVRVSIRTFGPANTKLCTAEKWTKEKKDEILEKVRGLEKLDPAGDTPLVRNLKDAYDEMLKTGDDANIILVLTDGVDEIYDPIKKDSVKTPSKDVKKQVQEFLKPGVMLNMVLLNLDKDDDALAKDSFDWIEKTTPETGTLFRASTTGELDEKLNAAMQDAIYPKLRLYIESGLRLPEDIYGKEIGKSKGGYTIARMEDTQLYWTHLLKVHPLDGYPPPFTKESLQQLKLKDGERLILNLERQGRKVVFKRGLFVEEEQRKSLDKKNAEKSKNWWLAEHYNRLQGKELHLFVTLENFTDLVNPNGPLEQIKPGFVWFEVSATNVDGQPDAKNIPLPIEIGNVTEYPAPAWYLHVRNWPGGKAKPVIRAWVTRDEPDAKSRIVTVGDLAGGARVKKTINVGGLDIDMYISLKKNQDVSLSYDGVKGPAVSAKRDCLVVQLDHPLNKRFIARQSGLKEEGHEHQMFFTKEGGQYTAKFWLDPSDELRANKDITIQVFPLEEFQSKAEKIELQLVNSPNGTNEPPEPPKPAK